MIPLAAMFLAGFLSGFVLEYRRTLRAEKDAALWEWKWGELVETVCRRTDQANMDGESPLARRSMWRRSGA